MCACVCMRACGFVCVCVCVCVVCVCVCVCVCMCPCVVFMMVCVAVCIILWSDNRRYEADLERTYKKFTLKPVTQIALVKENNLLFMLAGNANSHWDTC